MFLNPEECEETMAIIESKISCPWRHWIAQVGTSRDSLDPGE